MTELEEMLLAAFEQQQQEQQQHYSALQSSLTRLSAECARLAAENKALNQRLNHQDASIERLIGLLDTLTSKKPSG